ncbi:hypothetical protein CEXT_782431 [Caerostris extrusa]|uniref:Uncharacterized protein n=1 Tax=Caerostris extrusa TaxID=172846 RepID=A0AAV4MHU5_CAEEX|nr:hypothetical protein CEXT_782431 [Caerostris extrusa]
MMAYHRLRESGRLLSYRTGWSEWMVGVCGLNAAIFSNGVDRIIFSCNRLFIAAGGVAKVMDLRPFKLASVPLTLQIIYKHVGAMWYISEKPYMHCPFACVNRPESTVACEAFHQVIGHRGFGSPQHRPFASVNRPESSVTCEVFRPVIDHRVFGSR